MTCALILEGLFNLQQMNSDLQPFRVFWGDVTTNTTTTRTTKKGFLDASISLEPIGLENAEAVPTDFPPSTSNQSLRVLHCTQFNHVEKSKWGGEETGELEGGSSGRFSVLPSAHVFSESFFVAVMRGEVWVHGRNGGCGKGPNIAPNSHSVSMKSFTCVMCDSAD